MKKFDEKSIKELIQLIVKTRKEIEDLHESIDEREILIRNSSNAIGKFFVELLPRNNDTTNVIIDGNLYKVIYRENEYIIWTYDGQGHFYSL